MDVDVDAPEFHAKRLKLLRPPYRPTLDDPLAKHSNANGVLTPEEQAEFDEAFEAASRSIKD